MKENIFRIMKGKIWIVIILLMSVNGMFAEENKFKQVVGFPVKVKTTITKELLSVGDKVEIKIEYMLDTNHELYSKGDKFFIPKLSRSSSFFLYRNNFYKNIFGENSFDKGLTGSAAEVLKKDINRREKSLKNCPLQILNEDSGCELSDKKRSVVYKVELKLTKKINLKILPSNFH